MKYANFQGVQHVVNARSPVTVVLRAWYAENVGHQGLGQLASVRHSSAPCIFWHGLYYGLTMNEAATHVRDLAL